MNHKTAFGGCVEQKHAQTPEIHHHSGSELNHSIINVDVVMLWSLNALSYIYNNKEIHTSCVKHYISNYFATFLLICLV